MKCKLIAVICIDTYLVWSICALFRVLFSSPHISCWSIDNSTKLIQKQPCYNLFIIWSNFKLIGKNYLEYTEINFVSYAVMHLLLSNTTTLAATTNQRRPLQTHDIYMWHLEIPSYAIAPVCGSTCADISPGNFHDISLLLVISVLCKWCFGLIYVWSYDNRL